MALHLAQTEEFREDQARTIENARVLAETLASGGRAPRHAAAPTTTSLLVDVTPLGVTGREAEALLDDVGITVNKNAIPFDAEPAEHRVRASASARRRPRPAGMGPDEMRKIGGWIVEAIRERDEPAVQRADPRPRSASSSPGSRFPGSRATVACQAPAGRCG